MERFIKPLAKKINKVFILLSITLFHIWVSYISGFYGSYSMIQENIAFNISGEKKNHLNFIQTLKIESSMKEDVAKKVETIKSDDRKHEVFSVNFWSCV